MVKEDIKPIDEGKNLLENNWDLILYNDDINTFEFVIDSLIEVCEHELHQAEQCAYLAHYKGKCQVKEGNFSELKPRYDEMIRRGLTVSIE